MGIGEQLFCGIDLNKTASWNLFPLIWKSASHCALYLCHFHLQQDPRFEIAENGTLRINNVEVYDGTVFKCVSSTLAGSIEEQARVHILGMCFCWISLHVNVHRRTRSAYYWCCLENESLCRHRFLLAWCPQIMGTCTECIAWSSFRCILMTGQFDLFQRSWSLPLLLSPCSVSSLIKRSMCPVQPQAGRNLQSSGLKLVRENVGTG